MFSDGQETVSYFEQVLDNLNFDEIVNDCNHGTKEAIQPVSLLILDINMPILDGFEVITEVKQLFAKASEELDDKLSRTNRQ